MGSDKINKMSNMSVFESRTGILSCNPLELYSFIGDIRNFERFVPHDKINGWNAAKDSCSFSVTGLGVVNVAVSDRKEFTEVIYKGKALTNNNFTLNVGIDEDNDHRATVKVILEAELNPMLKMIASSPVKQFLELLINEMEKFRDWHDIKG